MKEIINELVGMGLRVVSKAIESADKKEIKIYLKSLEQVMQQIKETNNIDDRDKVSDDTKQ